ncbi:putative Endothiapepsin precursor [Parachaetomium inaequale]|uniref:Endothiapepsin n=1 Tax=Parachaetomium inaequale TaxID=2588326 RepID=A0AAN6PDQ9_9PEZI|nr:putative Endothiapepsin precursor [Parachaetomium inaequale]
MAVSKPPLRLITFLALLFLSSLVNAIPHDNKSTLTRRSVTLDLQRNPNYAPNGPAAYARALTKWGAKVPAELAASLDAMRGDVGVGDVGAETIRDDREYLSRVGFGTPLQWLSMDLDTGSADVWIYSSETRQPVAGERRVWKIEESSTAEKVENGTWMISYGDGSAAWGTLYRDTLSLASLTLPNATLESAVSASSSLTSDPYIDGIFGLPYALPSQTDPQQPSVLSSLLPSLAAPLFTVDLRHHSSSGAYTFGYVDPSRHKSSTPIWYTPLTPNATFWQFPYSGIHVGGNDTWYTSNSTAIADTGTSLLLLGRHAAEVYYGTVPGASKNLTAGGIWTYPCTLSTLENGMLPDFEIGFENGFVARVPGRFMNYTVMPDDTGKCMGGLQEWGNGEDLGIFGDVFLKAVYAVFDVGGGRIGFAEKELEGEGDDGDDEDGEDGEENGEEDGDDNDDGDDGEETDGSD